MDLIEGTSDFGVGVGGGLIPSTSFIPDTPSFNIPLTELSKLIKKSLKGTGKITPLYSALTVTEDALGTIYHLPESSSFSGGVYMLNHLYVGYILPYNSASGTNVVIQTFQPNIAVGTGIINSTYILRDSPPLQVFSSLTAISPLSCYFIGYRVPVNVPRN